MLTLALLVVVAAPVGAAPGTTQPVWQAAAWELQVIMQLVTAELCAKRILGGAGSAPAVEMSASTPSKIRANSGLGRRMARSLNDAPL